MLINLYELNQPKSLDQFTSGQYLAIYNSFLITTFDVSNLEPQV